MPRLPVTSCRSLPGSAGRLRIGAGAAGAAALLCLSLVGAPGASATVSGETYVALGDSYTSGPQIPTQTAGGCDRSTHDYPSDAASALGLHLIDVSCSGATTANILTTPETVSPGPTNPPQIGAVSANDPQIVSVQIGGNDLGFTTIIENCVALTPWGPTKVGSNCRDHYDPHGDNTLANDVAALAPTMATIIQEVHQSATNARVFVVGYPDILPQNGACWPSMPFETADAEYLNSIEVDLNTMLQDEASGNNATFVDTYTPSEGHNACAPESTRWVEPLVPASAADPFHPNATGEAQMATELENAVNG